MLPWPTLLTRPKQTIMQRWTYRDESERAGLIVYSLASLLFSATAFLAGDMVLGVVTAALTAVPIGVSFCIAQILR